MFSMKWRQTFERPDLLIFGVFILSLPFTWRKTLAILSPPGYSGFNEYLDISLSVSELLLILFIALYIFSNKKTILSSIQYLLFHVEHRYLIITPIVLFIMALISLLFAEQKALSFRAWFSLIEIALLYFYIMLQSVPRGTNCQSSTWNFLQYFIKIIIITALLQSIIGISQFLYGSSLGLHFLGESILSTSIPGVAEIIMGGNTYLRAYGTLLHPNVYGGFLFFSILSLIYVKKSHLFHVEQWFYALLLLVMGLAIILSFSKGAILALLIALFYYCSTWNNLISFYFNVPCGTLQQKIKSLFHVEHAYMLLMAIVFFSLILLQDSKYIVQSGKERLDMIPFTAEIIQDRPFFGIGPGQFVYKLANSGHFEPWKLQPVHNVYLLILTELGIISFLLIAVFSYKILKIVPRGTMLGKYSLSIMFGFLIIATFDHYLWDIQMGQWLGALTFGILASSTLTKH